MLLLLGQGCTLLLDDPSPAGSHDGGPDGVDARVALDADGFDARRPDTETMDGGSPDTGPPDSGPPDAGPPDTGPPPFPGTSDWGDCSVSNDTGILFCDGFETAFTYWETDERDGAELTATQRFIAVGGRALEAATTVQGRGEATVTAYVEDTSSSLWTRVFVRVPPAAEYRRTYFLQLSRWAGEGYFARLGLETDTRPHLFLAGHATPGEVVVSRVADPLPQEEWVCVEFEVQRVPENTWMFAYVRDTLVASVPIAPLERPFNVVQLGLVLESSEQPATDIYLDDVVISDRRIGCP